MKGLPFFSVLLCALVQRCRFPPRLGFCVPHTQSPGKLMQQCQGVSVCLSTAAAGHAVPRSESSPVGLGKGSSTPCSCTAVLFLLRLPPLKLYKRRT